MTSGVLIADTMCRFDERARLGILFPAISAALRERLLFLAEFFSPHFNHHVSSRCGEKGVME